MENPDIVILGAGGMGSLFGSILQEGGRTVALCDVDQKHVRAIRKNGLAITGFGGKRIVKLHAIVDVSEVSSAEVVLIQCKSNATRAAARSVRHLVRAGALCISFQNGLGNEEVIAEEVGLENVLGGITAMAAVKTGPGEVRDFSRVPSYIGELDGGLSERVTAIAKSFSKAGLETHASANIKREIWKKLLGNIANSALSGITNMTSAEFLAIPDLKRISIRALDEALAVAIRDGLALDRADVLRGVEMIAEPGGTGDNKSSSAWTC